MHIVIKMNKEEKDELRKFVNKVFSKKGYPPVKKFGAEFADGILF